MVSICKTILSSYFQQPPQGQSRDRALLKKRPEPGTSTGAGPSQEHPQKQDQVKDICGNRPEPVTSTRAYPSQPLLGNKALASKLSRSRTKQVISMEAGPNEHQYNRGNPRKTKQPPECRVISWLTETEALNAPKAATI